MKQNIFITSNIILAFKTQLLHHKLLKLVKSISKFFNYQTMSCQATYIKGNRNDLIALEITPTSCSFMHSVLTTYNILTRTFKSNI